MGEVDDMNPEVFRLVPYKGETVVMVNNTVVLHLTHEAIASNILTWLALVDERTCAKVLYMLDKEYPHVFELLRKRRSGLIRKHRNT